jgi:hypothetical protein
MGIPYSKQIHAAFDQVTPLVAEGFVVLQTTKNISILLTGIQVLTVILQLLCLFVLLGILFSVSPDLVEERKALVTPVMKSLAAWVMPGSEGRWILKVTGWTLLGVWLVACAAWAYYFAVYMEKVSPGGVEVPADDRVEMSQGRDVDAVKNGTTAQ